MIRRFSLARRAFGDVDDSVRLQLVRDKFIEAQAECSLRRHLGESCGGHEQVGSWPQIGPSSGGLSGG